MPPLDNEATTACSLTRSVSRGWPTTTEATPAPRPARKSRVAGEKLEVVEEEEEGERREGGGGREEEEEVDESGASTDVASFVAPIFVALRARSFVSLRASFRPESVGEKRQKPLEAARRARPRGKRARDAEGAKRREQKMRKSVMRERSKKKNFVHFFLSTSSTQPPSSETKKKKQNPKPQTKDAIFFSSLHTQAQCFFLKGNGVDAVSLGDAARFFYLFLFFFC